MPTLLAESPVTTTGLWGVLGVLAAGIAAALVSWASRKWGSKEPDEPSEKVAANIASREILTWFEEHTLKPMRADLVAMEKRADKLQGQLDKSEDALAEARSTVRELRAQIVFMEQRLTAKQEQIAILLKQLGDRYDLPDRSGTEPEHTAGIRRDPSGTEGH